METKNRVNRIRLHLLENQKTYLVGVGCLAAGYFLRKPPISIVNFISEAPKSDFVPSSGCIWIADHLMQELADTGKGEVTMESGEVIKLILTGVK